MFESRPNKNGLIGKGERETANGKVMGFSNDHPYLH